ncbi:MAG: hypothetical protein N4A74_10765 [Carboxylicivirga sp.]|jgi:hypothetical protein|nr:hypothetical protein [Carboxylicivirga sp.]
MKKNSHIPTQLILRKDLINPYELFILLVLIAALVFFSNSESNFIPFVSIVGIIVLGYRGMMRAKDRKPKIIIDKRGIELVGSKELHHWNDIKYAFVKYKTEGSGKNTESIAYLYIEAKRTKRMVKIEDFNYSRKRLKSTIEFYSGRDIGDESDLLRDQLKKELPDITNLGEVMGLFSSYKTRLIWISILIVLFMIVIGAVGSYSSIPYAFASCFTSAFVIMWIFMILHENGFRKNDVIRKLRNNEYKLLVTKFNVDYRKEKSGIIAFIVIGLVIFIIAYFL